MLTTASLISQKILSSSVSPSELSSPSYRLFLEWPSVALMLSSTFWCRNEFEAAVFIETAALRRPFNFLFRCIETEKEQMTEHI